MALWDRSNSGVIHRTIKSWLRTRGDVPKTGKGGNNINVFRLPDRAWAASVVSCAEAAARSLGRRTGGLKISSVLESSCLHQKLWKQHQQYKLLSRLCGAAASIVISATAIIIIPSLPSLSFLEDKVALQDGSYDGA